MKTRGYTLIELIVSVGIFALVMTLVSGAYLIMIAANRQAQALTNGMNNLSFALETMTREIRTGGNYCGGTSCPANTFYFTDPHSGHVITYSLASASTCGSTYAGSCITRMETGGGATPLTDPTVSVSILRFYTSDLPPSDAGQARVTVVVGGTTSATHGKTIPFYIETGATMRGTDL
jgi:prepilin-type N-terminal cleavage/methylation domain-containing protein